MPDKYRKEEQQTIFLQSKHEYTKGLLKSIPTVQDEKQRLKPIGGNPVDLLNMPAGCPLPKM